MADEFSLSVDNDWKKQAQEEKRKLAEAAAKKAAESAAAAAAPTVAPPVVPGAAPSPAGAGAGRAARGGRRELPQASFTTLVSSMMTQALYYLGDLDGRGGEGTVNLDMAKHQIDTLSMLEGKTASNLTEDEQKSLDLALYELRSRFVSVASQYIL